MGDLLSLKSFLLYFSHVSIFPACVSVHYLHAWFPQRLEEDLRIPGTVGCELLCGFWEPNLGSLEEHQTLLTTEPSLEPR